MNQKLCLAGSKYPLTAISDNHLSKTFRLKIWITTEWNTHFSLRGSNRQLEKKIPIACFLLTSLDTLITQVQELLPLSSISHIHSPIWLLHLGIQKPCSKLSSWPSQPCLPMCSSLSLPLTTQSNQMELRPKTSKPPLTPLFL